MGNYNKASELATVYRNYLACLQYYSETNGAYGDNLDMLNMYKEEIKELDTTKSLEFIYCDLKTKKKVK